LTGGIWLLDALVLAPRRTRVSVGGSESAPASTGDRSKIAVVCRFIKIVFPGYSGGANLALVCRGAFSDSFRIDGADLAQGRFYLGEQVRLWLRLPVLNAKLIENGQPKRGDVVVFRYPLEPAVAYIKRVVGLPGDRLAYRQGQLVINGQAVSLTPLVNGGTAETGYRQFTEQLGEVTIRSKCWLMAVGGWRDCGPGYNSSGNQMAQWLGLIRCQPGIFLSWVTIAITAPTAAIGAWCRKKI
jgi:signal peptidase I